MFDIFVYGVGSCAQVYIVRDCEFSMEQEATKVVGSGISANTGTERAKWRLIPPVYSLRGIRAYGELQLLTFC